MIEVKDMEKYLIRKLDENQYFLVCMDYNSVLNYLDVIENEPFIQNNQGDLVVDQLLVAGNGKNRFLICQFSYGEIILETAKNIDVPDTLRRNTSELLNQHFEALKYSILTKHQLDMIRQGQMV